MKVNVETIIKDLKGNPIKDNGGQEDVTLKSICVTALLSASKDQTGGFDKYKSYQLAKKIEESKEVILTAEEVTGIKKLVDAFFGPVIVGPVFDLLDPQEDKKK